MIVQVHCPKCKGGAFVKFWGNVDRFCCTAPTCVNQDGGGYMFSKGEAILASERAGAFMHLKTNGRQKTGEVHIS